MKTTETTLDPDGNSMSVTKEDLCSVEVNRNAKGEYTIGVKAYAETTNAAAEVAVETMKWTEGLLGIRKTEAAS